MSGDEMKGSSSPQQGNAPVSAQDQGMNRRSFIRVATWVAAGTLASGSALLTACSTLGQEAAPKVDGSAGAAGSAPPKEIVIGAVVGMTGNTAQWGQPTAQTLQMAVDEINSAGGVKSLGGAKLKLIVEDHESKPDIGAARAEKLAQQGVHVLTGCVTSSVGVVVASVAERMKVPFLDGGDTSPQIVQRGFRYVFLLRPTGIQLANKSVQFAKWAGEKTGHMPKKVGVITQDDTAGSQIGQTCAEKAKEMGWEVVDYVRYSASTAKDFTGPLSKFKQQGVDTLFQHGQPADTVILIKDLKSLGFSPNVVGILGGAVSRVSIDNLKGDAEYLLGGTDFNPAAKVPAIQAVSAKYTAATGKALDTVAAIGYWSVGVIHAAVEKAASYDRDKIRDAMRSLQLKPGESYWLLPAPLKFNEDGLNEGADVIITQVIDGKHQPVYPESQKAVDLVWPRPKW